MAIRTLSTVDQVIDAGLGGTAAAARIVRKYGAKCGDTAVSNWRQTGRLPPKYFLIFGVELGRQRLRARPELFGIIPIPQKKRRA